MTKEEFAAQCEQAAAVAKDLPLSSTVLAYLAAELKKGDPLWWRETAKAWRNRNFATWTEAWSLLLAAIHFEALNSEDSPFTECFPSCGGAASDPRPALAEFLAKPPASFFENLRTAERRVYSALRAGQWLVPAQKFFQERALPFYIVEVNAGAGLNLASDIITPQEGFDSTMIQARIGLDPNPLSLDNISHRRWLTAAHWPDHMPAIEELDQAIAIAGAKLQEEQDFIQLEACPPELAPKFIAKNIPAEEGLGLLVLNIGVISRMTDKVFSAYTKDMSDMLQPWGNRGLWVEVENSRASYNLAKYQILLGRILEGNLKGQLLGELFGTELKYHPPGLAFLAVHDQAVKE
ncbi:MAG: DUF2332 family protein [Elusimicrobia bacterium]|nr:DUF2332 family protein [Elusimicrobiota bacterium]